MQDFFSGGPRVFRLEPTSSSITGRLHSLGHLFHQGTFSCAFCFPDTQIPDGGRVSVSPWEEDAHGPLSGAKSRRQPVHHLPQPAVLVWWVGSRASLPAPAGGSCEAPPPLSLLLGSLDGLLLLLAGVTVPSTAPSTSYRRLERSDNFPEPRPCSPRPRENPKLIHLPGGFSLSLSTSSSSLQPSIL